MNSSDWIDLVRKSGLVDAETLASWLERCKQNKDAGSIASLMVDEQLLTTWQADLLLRGKWKGFFIDHYCVLNHLETSNSRGTRSFSAIDKDTGSHVTLEVAWRARTKDGKLFYVVHNGA